MSSQLLASGLVLLGVLDLVAGVGVLATLGAVVVLDPARPWPVLLLRGLVFVGGVMAASLLPAVAAWSGAALLVGRHPWGWPAARLAAALHLPVPVLGWGVALASVGPRGVR